MRRRFRICSAKTTLAAIARYRSNIFSAVVRAGERSSSRGPCPGGFLGRARVTATQGRTFTRTIDARAASARGPSREEWQQLYGGGGGVGQQLD